ncbi:MAG: hypothetical protein AB1600_06675 [Bacteroidota bacterium]
MSSLRIASPITYNYQFSLNDGREIFFEIRLDPNTLEFIPSSDFQPPEWTKIDFYPCEGCPLLDKVQRCPVAVNLSRIIEPFKHTVSHTPAVVKVETESRVYSKETTVQNGLSSIIGICMVTSNCPVMDELRPLTRYHLPFATPEETLFRVASYYLLRQFFIAKDGGTPDWNLSGLIEIYKKISAVNVGISRRISQASESDANVNAVIILHSYGESIPFFVENELDEIRYLFEQFLKDRK